MIEEHNSLKNNVKKVSISLIAGILTLGVLWFGLKTIEKNVGVDFSSIYEYYSLVCVIVILLLFIYHLRRMDKEEEK